MTVICGRGKARVRGRRRDRARWSVSRGDAEEAASLVGFVMCSGCGVIADYSLLSKIEKCLFPELNAGMRMRASQVKCIPARRNAPLGEKGSRYLERRHVAVADNHTV